MKEISYTKHFAVGPFAGTSIEMETISGMSPSSVARFEHFAEVGKILGGGISGSYYTISDVVVSDERDIEAEANLQEYLAVTEGESVVQDAEARRIADWNDRLAVMDTTLERLAYNDR